MTKNIIFGLGEKFLQREGLTETVQPWEDGMRTDGSRGSFEWWYFDAQFEDGTTAVMVFSTKPLHNRLAPLTPGVSLTINLPDGEKHFRFATYSEELFTASRECCRLHIGPHRVSGNLSNYELQMEFNDMGVDLHMTGSVPPWRPGSGINYYDKKLNKYFAWLPVIPFGQVEGQITVAGITRSVIGSCYHDHNWGNVGLESVMSHWYWGRAHVDDFTLIFVEMQASPVYNSIKIPVFMLAKGNRIITGDGRHLTLQVKDNVQYPVGRTYPRQAFFRWRGKQGAVDIILSAPHVIEATSLLGMLPWWKRKLVRPFSNPYYFRFNSSMKLKFDINDFKKELKGQALYEIMYLR